MQFVAERGRSLFPSLCPFLFCPADCRHSPSHRQQAGSSGTGSGSPFAPKSRDGKERVERGENFLPVSAFSLSFHSSGGHSAMQMSSPVIDRGLVTSAPLSLLPSFLLPVSCCLSPCCHKVVTKEHAVEILFRSCYETSSDNCRRLIGDTATLGMSRLQEI